MHESYSKLLSQQRKCIYYVPWLSLLSFIIVLAGTITWGVGVSNALKNANGIFDALRMDLDAQMNFAQKVAVFVVAGCCILAAGMLAMSSGRSCTEFAVDRRGQPTRGSAYWLGANVFVTVLWWLILVLLMFVFYICCLALGSMVVVTQTLRVVAISADKFIDAGIKYRNVTRTILEAQLGPLPPQYGATCPSNCLTLDILEYFLERDVCVCGADRLLAAYGASRQAQDALVGVVVGAFLVWVGASFLLMNATADFAQGRRERALLMRLRRTLAAGGLGASDAAALSSSSDPQLEGQLQDQQQQGYQQQELGGGGGGGGAAAHTGIELAVAAVAAYGMRPPYGGGGGGGGYSDVDKVPLLKDPQLQPAYQEPYQQQTYEQQPYQQQEPYPYHQQQSFQQQHPYHQQQQQPYAPAAEQQYGEQQQGAIAAVRGGAPADGGGRESLRRGPSSRA